MSNTESLVQENINPKIAYLGSIRINGIKPFITEQKISFTNQDNKPAKWTVILGENNTGKTSLLKTIADLAAVKAPFEQVDDSVKLVPFNLVRSIENNTSANINPPEDFSVFCNILILENESKNYINHNNFSIYNNLSTSQEDSLMQWGFSKHLWKAAQIKDLEHFKIFSYGINRKMGKNNLSDIEFKDKYNIFSNDIDLINAEEWLLQTDYAVKNGSKNAVERLDKIKAFLISGVLPGVKDFKFTTNEELKNYVELLTDYGWTKISDLGYGYQTSIAWLVDLAKKMFDRYPKSENPLAEPAIVLVDELDLHLHPQWQREIIQFLDKQFPNTQFIVTTHSPIIIQSAENINLVLLVREENHTVIKQQEFHTFKGWTVEEILNEMMGLGDKTQSDFYLKLIDEFDKALDEDNYEMAQKAYAELDIILHPASSQRKLLKIQMASLSPH
ncbi:MAG: AAA family ATPase [Adhaeribacter sp.]